MDYIVRNLEDLDDIYALAVSSYALSLAQHSAKDAVFNLFETKAKTSGKWAWGAAFPSVNPLKNEIILHEVWGVLKSNEIGNTAYLQ